MEHTDNTLENNTGKLPVLQIFAWILLVASLATGFLMTAFAPN